MEGPTPVSALIHAATMVAAGVYLICRIFGLLTPEALWAIAWIGCATSAMAALMALQQNDIKRILACSTLSQLGYMVMAVGAGAPNAAMFHLFTHACFKALLFLAPDRRSWPPATSRTSGGWAASSSGCRSPDGPS